MDGDAVALAAVMLMFGGIPITAMLTSHFRKMAEIRLKATQQGDQSVVGELRALKQQMAELRDTTSRFDVAFDAALQRIENRVGHLEARAASSAAASVDPETLEARASRG